MCIVRHRRSEEHSFNNWASQTHFIECTFQSVHAKIQHTPKALNMGWTDLASWLVSETLFFFFGQHWATSETSVKDLDGRSQRGTTVRVRHAHERNHFVKLFISRNHVMIQIHEGQTLAEGDLLLALQIPDSWSGINTPGPSVLNHNLSVLAEMCFCFLMLDLV